MTYQRMLTETAPKALTFCGATWDIGSAWKAWVQPLRTLIQRQCQIQFVQGMIMGRRKPTTKTEFVLFNITYEDGTVTSNRRAPGEVLESLDGEAAVEAFFSQQDREIAERSGKPRAQIKAIEQVNMKKLKAQGKSNSKAA
ncbi:MAG: hypothetical protein ACK5KM_03725 [Hyphomicrobiaceae bacterium]